MNNMTIEIKFFNRHEASEFCDLLDIMNHFLLEYDNNFSLGNYFVPALITSVREQIFEGMQKDQELEEDEVY